MIGSLGSEVVQEDFFHQDAPELGALPEEEQIAFGVAEPAVIRRFLPELELVLQDSDQLFILHRRIERVVLDRGEEGSSIADTEWSLHA